MNNFFLESDIASLRNDGRHRIECPACKGKTLGKIKKDNISKVEIGCRICGFPGDSAISLTKSKMGQVEFYLNSIRDKIKKLENNILECAREIGEQNNLLKKSTRTDQ